MTKLVRRLLAGAALCSCLAATAALAEPAPPSDAAAGPGASTTSAAAEGADVQSVIVTAERSQGAKVAPTKGSVDEFQPESIISHDFIEAVTPDVGNISTVVFIAPSVSGISGNAGGIGNYFSTTLRGFPDGFYNVTYDGIAFGDTNNPTHHPNDYFPVSTIGAAVVDRGPGAAGDLGQANYGGAIHYFSPTPADHAGLFEKLTYGSFNTGESVTTLNTGETPWLLGGKLWIDADERYSNTELSFSQGSAETQALKYVLPKGDRFLLTAFYTHTWSRYNFPDSDGPGETLQQTQLYGKDFQLTDIPSDEHYEGFNFERKATHFAYIDAKYNVLPGVTVDDQPYLYFYSNKTESSNNNNGLIGATNSAPKAVGLKTDIGGYLKRNDYTVYGNVFRFAVSTPLGTLKAGALVEGSDTYRQKAYYDLTTGQPDVQYTPAKDPLLKAPSNCKTCENSNWHQEQGFVDFDFTLIPNLTVSPGFKYVNFVRKIDAAEDTLTLNGASTIGPILGKNDYDSPLYFLTANYKLRPFWSVYAQYATSFLIPQLSALQVPGVSLQKLNPETAVTYQGGTVFSRGPVNLDADAYLIIANNTNVACNIPDPNGGFDAATCNAGKVHYSGFEGEGALVLGEGWSAFVNGSINDARQLAQAANAQAGIAGNPSQPLAGVPGFTAAGGLLYRSGPWQGSAVYKRVGGQFVAGGLNGEQIHIPAYDTLNGDLAYTFDRYQLKLQVFNALDHRTIVNYVPSGSETALFQTNGGIYTYQSGREIDLSLSVRF